MKRVREFEIVSKRWKREGEKEMSGKIEEKELKLIVFVFWVVVITLAIAFIISHVPPVFIAVLSLACCFVLVGVIILIIFELLIRYMA